MTVRVGRVKTEFEGDHVHLYLWDDAGGPKHLLVYGDENRPYPTESRIRVEEGERAPHPSLVLRREVWEALKHHLVQELADRDALNEHLQDAVRVRDRLLALVERKF